MAFRAATTNKITSAPRFGGVVIDITTSINTIVPTIIISVFNIIAIITHTAFLTQGFLSPGVRRRVLPNSCFPDCAPAMSESGGRMDLPTFKPVAFEVGQIHVRGGCLTKALPCQSKTIPLEVPHPGRDTPTKTFVKLGVNEDWLIKSATGKKSYHQSCFPRTSLLSVLHEKIKAYEYDKPRGDGAENEDPMDPTDPMASLEGNVATEPFAPTTEPDAPRKQRRVRYKTKARAQIIRVEMTELPPEEAPEGSATRVISLYVVDRVQIWLDMEDVPWAIRYLYVQSQLKGVPVVDPDSAGPFGAEPSLAQFETPPKKGTRAEQVFGDS